MEFRNLLLNVSRALSKHEVKALAFLCTDLSRSSSSVELASDLFSLLGDQDLLSAERPHLLTELLLTIQRTRLVRELGLNHQVSATNSFISPYRKLLYNLSEDITTDELGQMKFLLNDQLPRRKLNESITTLEVFLELEHLDLLSSTNLSLLETIIKSVCPMLKEKIHRFEATQERFTGPIAEEMGRPRSVSYPLEQNQVPQSLATEHTASCEIPGLQLFPEPPVNLSCNSVDFSNASHGGDVYEDLSHGLSELTTETSNYDSSEERTDAVEISPSQEDLTSTKQKTFHPAHFQTTNTKNEGLGTYPMTSAKRGICLILNNYDFTGSKISLKMREGTKIDEKNLCTVFEWLGFKVEIRRDCKREEMLSIIREFAGEIHSEMDCLVVCVLSHGVNQGVYGVDGLTVELQELMEPFNGSRCSSLAEKPKLFFIQACQGIREQEAFYIEADGPIVRDPRGTYVSIASDADFLLGMATIPNFVSFRDRSHGTWYIQSLCQNLIQMVPSGTDLVSILTKVNADVSQKTAYAVQKKQMPQPAFTLRSKVVFPIPGAPPPSLQL